MVLVGPAKKVSAYNRGIEQPFLLIGSRKDFIRTWQKWATQFFNKENFLLQKKVQKSPGKMEESLGRSSARGLLITPTSVNGWRGRMQES